MLRTKPLPAMRAWVGTPGHHRACDDSQYSTSSPLLVARGGVGFTQCWTAVSVLRLNLGRARNLRCCVGTVGFCVVTIACCKACVCHSTPDVAWVATASVLGGQSIPTLT